jgi:inner membrane protein YidH
MAGSNHSDEAGDASRRTHLANERTLLAWWRSGLTALGVGVAVGRVLPEFGHHARWPYVALGAAYTVLGFALVLYGTVRQREVGAAVVAGRFTWPERHVVSALALLACFIGLATLVLILVDV